MLTRVKRNDFGVKSQKNFENERIRSPGRGERLSTSKRRGPQLRVQRLVRRLTIHRSMLTYLSLIVPSLSVKGETGLE